jgi:hypothetical protein
MKEVDSVKWHFDNETGAPTRLRTPRRDFKDTIRESVWTGRDLDRRRGRPSSQLNEVLTTIEKKCLPGAFLNSPSTSRLHQLRYPASLKFFLPGVPDEVGLPPFVESMILVMALDGRYSNII